MTTPENFLVIDSHGIPDHVVNAEEITDDGFTLAARICAARGDQHKITAAISDALDKYQDHPQYVFVSALTQLGRDLVPMVASLCKSATGVDWHAHCEAMLSDDYNPHEVNQHE